MTNIQKYTSIGHILVFSVRNLSLLPVPIMGFIIHPGLRRQVLGEHTTTHYSISESKNKGKNYILSIEVGKKMK